MTVRAVHLATVLVFLLVHLLAALWFAGFGPERG